MSSEASKGVIRISESQLLLERRRKVTNKKWHQNVMNLILGKNVCCSCLRFEEDLLHWDAEFVWLRCEYEIEMSLKNIMLSTFGPDIINIIPAANFCQKCVDIIISAYLFMYELRNNCKHIQSKLTEITQQMKWTEYLDETGSLTEALNNKINLDDSTIDPNTDLSYAKTENNILSGINKDLDKNIKTHKIVLNNESLKMKLLSDSSWHKFLIREEKMTDPILPASITVKKVRKSVEMSDFAPHDLLELNWAEEDDSVNPEKPVPSSKLHSNEALIMNLMEKAKTVEKHIHFHENLQLQATTKELASVPVAEQNDNDSLSVKLISSTAKENNSDNEDILPQDLLEIKWPEESQDATHTKIPVKKLKFNEALTVKYIPSHKLRKVTGSGDEVVPHELLELNWTDENTDMPTNHTDGKHNIDLTQWLRDQGMRTIKAKSNLSIHNKKRITKNLEPKLKKNSYKETSDVMLSEIQPFETVRETSDGNTLEDLLNYNVIVKNTAKVKEPGSNVIRCALCNLSFIQFESYWSHYKTHKITEGAKCYRCPAKFAVIELLVEHLLLMHSEDMAYCTLCYALLSQGRVARHMVDYHAKKVEVINAGNSQGIEDHCKKCNRIVTNSNKAHVCEIKCTECIFDCVHEKYLASHREQRKANADVFKCVECAYQYKTVQAIISHANYVHLKRKTHQCPFCNAKFSLPSHLTNHCDSHHFRCRCCEKVFADKIDLDDHKCPRSYVFANKLTCEICGEKFIALKCYWQHKKTALAASDECVICHCSIPNRCNMARHIQQVHNLCLKIERNTTSFECTKCQANFQNDVAFTRHACLYQCRICTRNYSVKSLYEKHLQVHADGSESLTCSLCDLQLADKRALANHMNSSHSNHEKCPVCLIYIEKKIFKQHLKSHDKEQELKCPHCPFTCDNQNLYEVHVNRFHLMNRPYECDICRKSFYGKHRLREHIRLHSSEARSEKCTLCSKKFAKKRTLNKHMRLHKTGELYDCDLCGKRFISAALLSKHQMTHGRIRPNLPETSQNSN